MNGQILLNALMVFFTAHIIYTYLSNFKKGATFHKAYYYTAWAIYILFQYLVMVFHSNHPVLTLLGNLILMTILLHSLGCMNIMTAVFRACILYASWMAAEVVTQSILFATLDEDPFVAGNIISTIAMYIIIQLYKQWNGRGQTAPLSFRHWIKLFFVPAASMLITYYAYAITLHSGKMAFFYFLTILIILINYLIFDVYDKISAQALIEKQKQAYEQEINLCIKQAADREEAYLKTRTLRHDLKGRLIALKAMLEVGQTQEVRAEISKMLEENSLNRYGIAETGNLAFDALINYKYATSLSKGFRLNCILDVPSELPVAGTDLCVILGNLLDNAIDAVEKLPKEEDRWINLHVQFTKGVLLITVENPYNGLIRRDKEGQIRSSKTGDHGIGLLSVMRTAEKYDGDISIKDENGLFLISVVLCQKDFLHEDP